MVCLRAAALHPDPRHHHHDKPAQRSPPPPNARTKQSTCLCMECAEQLYPPKPKLPHTAIKPGAIPACLQAARRIAAWSWTQEPRSAPSARMTKLLSGMLLSREMTIEPGNLKSWVRWWKPRERSAQPAAGATRGFAFEGVSTARAHRRAGRSHHINI